MSVELVCPSCGRGRIETSGPTASCGNCEALYDTRNGVPDLAPNLVIRPGVAQRFMQAAWVVSIYESRLWRKGPAFSFLAGIDFDSEFSAVLESAAPSPDSDILDIACGSGLYTRPLARKVPRGSVVGLDLSRAMLSYAAKRAKKEGLSNASFVRASALALPFAEGSFDAVNLCGALHLFPDPALAVSEAGRVLKPGGRFTVAAVGEGGGIIPAVQSAVASLMGIRSFTCDQLSVMFRSAGFADVRPILETPRWIVMRGLRS